MKIEKFGTGNNLFNIIVGVHGNEVSPIKGFILLKKYLHNKKINKSFSVIIANEEAIAKKKRFVDMDLNRCFPGNEKGKHEEKLAAQLYADIKKTDYNFDFHAALVRIENPYGIVSVYNDKLNKIMATTGVENYIFDQSESLIKFAPNSFAIEVGYEHDSISVNNAFEIMRNILIYFGVIDEEKKVYQYDPAIYLIYHFVVKEQFLSISPGLEDFKKVKKDDAIGILKNNETLIASEDFYTILINDESSFKKAKRIIIEE